MPRRRRTRRAPWPIQDLISFIAGWAGIAHQSYLHSEGRPVNTTLLAIFAGAAGLPALRHIDRTRRNRDSDRP